MSTKNTLRGRASPHGSFSFVMASRPPPMTFWETPWLLVMNGHAWCIIRHDSWGVSQNVLGVWGEKSYRQKCARHVGKQNGQENSPRESSERVEHHAYWARNFEAMPFVTTGGRQTPDFGSNRQVSGQTFSAFLLRIFWVPLTNEKLPHNPFHPAQHVCANPAVTTGMRRTLKSVWKAWFPG